MNHALLEMLYEALETENGLAVETNNPKALRAKLYTTLREDPLPLSLTIVGDEVWILKKETNNETEDTVAEENPEST